MEIIHLENWINSYLESDERVAKMQKSIGYRLLLGAVMAIVSFLELRGLSIGYLSVFAVTLTVAFPSLIVSSVLESFYYSVLTILGALLAMKYNKQIMSGMRKNVSHIFEAFI